MNSFHFADSHVALFLEKRKNDHFREGSWVFVARWNCQEVLASRKPFSGLSVISTCIEYQEEVHLQKESMSHNQAMELVKKELCKIGLDPPKFGLHSLRSEEASVAAALGVVDRLFQRHGCWCSRKDRNNFLKETLDVLLLVTKSI